MDHQSYYTTTQTTGSDQLHLPTPVEIVIDADDYLITVKGADGQQVMDVMTQAIQKLPSQHKQSNNGYVEFCTGLIVVSLVAAGLVNIITWVIQPKSEPVPIRVSLVGDEDERGSGR